MRADDVVRQLWAVVPTLTEKFSDDLIVSSITSVGIVATVTTATDHGLIDGSPVSISGSRVPNTIVNLEQSDNVALAETALPHDLTEGFPNTTVSPVKIEGAIEADYNGSHTLLSVPDRTHFTYKITGDPSSPATGSPILLENLKFGYDGLHSVTVTSPTTFTYPIAQALGGPALGTIVCRVRMRISSVISTDRLEDSYTAQQSDKLWAFVVLGDRVANKSRSTSNDSVSDTNQPAAFRQFVIQPFSIYVAIPTTQSIGGSSERDEANDLLSVFTASVVGINFDSNFNEQPYSLNVFERDGSFLYNASYYIHQYQFETTEYITFPDIAGTDYGVAFRDISVNYNSGFTDKSIMTDGIDLDDSAS